jgi:hypothetical protein
MDFNDFIIVLNTKYNKNPQPTGKGTVSHRCSKPKPVPTPMKPMTKKLQVDLYPCHTLTGTHHEHLSALSIPLEMYNSGVRGRTSTRSARWCGGGEFGGSVLCASVVGGAGLDGGGVSGRSCLGSTLGLTRSSMCSSSSSLSSSD